MKLSLKKLLLQCVVWILYDRNVSSPTEVKQLVTQSVAQTVTWSVLLCNRLESEHLTGLPWRLAESPSFRCQMCYQLMSGMPVNHCPELFPCKLLSCPCRTVAKHCLLQYVYHLIPNTNILQLFLEEWPCATNNRWKDQWRTTDACLWFTASLKGCGLTSFPTITGCYPLIVWALLCGDIFTASVWRFATELTLSADCWSETRFIL